MSVNTGSVQTVFVRKYVNSYKLSCDLLQLRNEDAQLTAKM